MFQARVSRINTLRVYCLLIFALFLIVLVSHASTVAVTEWKYILAIGAIIAILESKIVVLLDRRFSMTMASGVLLAVSTNIGIFPALCGLALAAPVLLVRYRRKPLTVIFNLSEYGLSAYFALLTYQSFGGQYGHYKGSELALLAYAIVYMIANITAVLLYLVSDGQPFDAWSVTRHMVGFQTLVLYIVEMTIGVFMGFVFQTYQMAGLITFPIVLWLIGVSYQKYFEAANAARTDSLTGLLNRNAFQRELERRLARQCVCSVLMIDLDHFKTLNDTFGHLCGDQAIQEIATLLSDKFGPNAVIARYGGEEFCVILPLDCGKACDISERILEQVSQYQLKEIGTMETQIRITASIGIAAFPEHGRTLRELLEHADNALYQAKTRRNTVKVYQPILEDVLQPV